MSAAAFETVAHLEVVLRNAIDISLSKFYDEPSRGIPWFLCHPPMNEETAGSVDAVRERLRAQHHDTRHQVVAGLSFGFWSGMLGRRYEELWRSTLHQAFPRSPGTRKQVMSEVEGIRKLRNRLAHHDSMLSIDIPFEMRRVMKVADFISADAAAWLRQIDRSTEVYRQRPPSPFDTVVVPARDAWPFYEKHSAYVCQPSRWFQPVDRIAFYADQEVKQDVPRITHRRDNVSWSPKSEQDLASSTDRSDRQIAAVIKASRLAGWSGGSYQVFLLTADGHPDHRRLPKPVPHQTSGRGSAFVQRQRYLSLHSLEIASTTAELASVPNPLP